MELFNVHPNSQYALKTHNKDAREQPKIVITKAGERSLPSGFHGVAEYYVPPGHHACFYGKQRHFCVKGPTGKNMYDVDPDWLYKNPVERYRLIKNCDHPALMWDNDCMQLDKDKITGTICADKKSTCYKNRVAYCNKLQSVDKVDPNCIPFCMNNHGKCDNLMIKWCKDNESRTECNCLNSAALKYNPMCIDAKCIKDGYTTQDMHKKCPVLDCTIYYDIQNTGDIEFIDQSIQQKCSTKTLKQQLPEDKAKTEAEIAGKKVYEMPLNAPAEPEPEPAVAPAFSWMQLLVFIVLSMVVILVFVWIYSQTISGSSSSSSTGSALSR